MNSNDHSSAFIDASSSLLPEHRSQRTVNFNLDPPSYSSVIADDSRHTASNRGARSSLIESQNSPYTIGTDPDHEFNADGPYSERLRSSWNSSTQPPYPTGPANFRGDGNAAPYPTAPTFTTMINRAPYPSESSGSMLGFRTDYETSRPGSGAMPEPVEMEDISIISAKTPYPTDGPSGMPMPQSAPQAQNPIGFTNAVTVRNKSRSPTPKYRPYESSTRSTESPIRSTQSPIRSTSYTQLPRRIVPGSYQAKENPRRDMSNMNVIFAIFAVLLMIAIIAVVIKVIVVVRTA